MIDNELKMRMVVPNVISAFTDIFAPYMVKNDDGTSLILREDAPNDVKAAYKQYCDWWKKEKGESR